MSDTWSQKNLIHFLMDAATSLWAGLKKKKKKKKKEKVEMTWYFQDDEEKIYC